MYEFEDIRYFVVKRNFLVGTALISSNECTALKARTLSLPPERVALIRAFMVGWADWSSTFPFGNSFARDCPKASPRTGNRQVYK
jgi:hypothetical protein